ncbi:50S ribosomal protein L10 [Chloroflexota bacterium]
MPTEKKSQTVEQLVEVLSQNGVVIATDYRGLSVSQISELRHQLRQHGVEYRVVKNTLANLAAERAGKSALSPLLKGPTALALASGNEAALAKALLTYQRTSKTTVSIRGGLLGALVMDNAQITALATLPSREVLLGKLLGAMKGPLFALQNVLTGNISGLLRVLQSRVEQMGGLDVIEESPREVEKGE